MRKIFADNFPFAPSWHWPVRPLIRRDTGRRLHPACRHIIYHFDVFIISAVGGRRSNLYPLAYQLIGTCQLCFILRSHQQASSQQPGSRSQLNIKPNKRGISVVMEGEIVIVSGRNEETAASDTSNNFFRLLLCRSLYHCLQSGICRKCYYVAYCLRDFDRKRCRAFQIFIFNVRISLTSEGGSGNLHIYILSIFCGVCH